MGDPGNGVATDASAALDALSVLSKKWHPVVVVVLERGGPMGFNDLLEAIPDVSGKVLSETLQALEDEGVVDRTVVSESPLRVRYELTDAGRDLEPIFDALAEWGRGHLERAPPTVAVAGPDRRLTELYGAWLDERYEVVRAHDVDELEAALERDPDVVVVDRDLPGTPEGVLEDAPPACRTVALVGRRPEFDVLELACDDVLRKPVVRKTALETVEAQLARRGEPDERRELAALEAKRSVLESHYSPNVLAENDTYAALRSRLEALERRLDG